MSKISQLKKKQKKLDQLPKKIPWKISEGQLVMDMLMGDIDWKLISRKDSLDINFVKEYKDYLHWDIISSKSMMPKSYYALFTDKLHWRNICMYQQLTPIFIKKYSDYLYWDVVANTGIITTEIFDEFFENLYLGLNLPGVFKNRKSKMSCDVIEKYSEYYDNDCWNAISEYKLITEKFIEKHKDQLNWNILSKYQTLSEEFVLRNKKRIKWNNISFNSFNNWSCKFKQEEIIPCITSADTIMSLLDLNYITEYMLSDITEPTIWKDISYYAKLSEDFIRTNIKKLSKTGIMENRNIDYNLKLKLKKEMIFNGI